jgi:bacterial/archaeal transporter family-2 protein
MVITMVIAFLAGVTRTIARMVNAELSERVGPFQSTWYNYVLGLICSVLMLLVTRDFIPASALTPMQIPVWAYLGGVVGVLFVVLSNLTTPKMTALSMTLLIFVGQIAAGIGIDIVVHQQLALGKIVGGLLILVGLLGNLSIDTGRKMNGFVNAGRGRAVSLQPAQLRRSWHTKRRRS